MFAIITMRYTVSKRGLLRHALWDALTWPSHSSHVQATQARAVVFSYVGLTCRYLS